MVQIELEIVSIAEKDRKRREKYFEDLVAGVDQVKGVLLPSITACELLYCPWSLRRTQSIFTSPCTDPTASQSCSQTTWKYDSDLNDIVRDTFDCLVGPIPELVRAKSAWHWQLQKILVKSKTEVFRLVATAGNTESGLVERHERAANMTKQLTSKGQRWKPSDRLAGPWSSCSRDDECMFSKRFGFVIRGSGEREHDDVFV